MREDLNYNKLFWLVHITGWLAFISYDLYADFEFFSKGVMRYYWSISVISLFLILPIVRNIFKRILVNNIFNFKAVLKILIIILIVGLIRKLLDYTVYIALNISEESIWQLLLNIYYDQIINFLFIKGIIQLSVPVFFWAVLYFGIKFWFDLTTEKQKSEKAFLLAQQANLQMLRYQLNPHFLFNSLNSIQALMYENRNLADKMLTELSEFLRYTLAHKEKVFVPLKHEFDVIQKYLSIEKIRFEEKFEYTIESSKEADEFEILHFLLQPLVENAVKHGIKTSSIPLQLRINAVVKNNILYLEISNTGKWIEIENEGTGIENITNRLNNAYSNNYKFETFEKDNQVYIHIELPGNEE